MASRSHLTAEVNEFIQDLEKEGKTVEMISVGSSLKLCLVGEGSANVYPRFGPTMEWDTWRRSSRGYGIRKISS